MPTRYSKHYYDLAMMAQIEVKNEALADLELLKNVVEFRLDSLEKDYKAMQNMIFDKFISFDEIIGILGKLEKEIIEA